MTQRIDASFGEPAQRRRDTSVLRGLGLLALATVVAGMVFASSETFHVSAAGSDLRDVPVATPAAPPGRFSAPRVVVPTPDFDPATLRTLQPAVGMPEHG